MGKAGYEYLLVYKLTVVIYDLTVQFCNQYIPKNSRTHDQMVQAARSGMANIAEGNKHTSLKGYIYLTGIARGSIEELIQDYLAFARQNQIQILDKSETTKQIPQINKIWQILKATPTLPDHPDFPDLPDTPEKTTNLMLTLTNQANYLLDKLINSLKDKHMKEGGLTENLYRRRTAFRSGKSGGSGKSGESGI